MNKCGLLDKFKDASFERSIQVDLCGCSYMLEKRPCCGPAIRQRPDRIWVHEEGFIGTDFIQSKNVPKASPNSSGHPYCFHFCTGCAHPPSVPQ